METKKEEVFHGAEFLQRVSIPTVQGFTMDDYDFECEFYVYSNRPIKKKKIEMQRVDNNAYVVKLDSLELGLGVLRCRITAYLPDTYGGNDWLRTTPWDGETNTIIIKRR